MKQGTSWMLAAVLFVGVISTSFIVHPVRASTITVPDDYATIQEAINAASDGDTIYVRNGVYNEDVTVNKALTLTGESMMTTIQNGSITVACNDCGINSLNLSSSSIHVEWGSNISIEDNAIDKGGVWLSSSEMQVDNAYIINNTITSGYISLGAWWGPAVEIFVINNLIKNSSQYGIFVLYNSRGLIENNTIVDSNYGIYSESYDLITIRNNVFENNSNAIFAMVGSANIIGNKIYDSRNAAILTADHEDLTVQDNHLWKNKYGFSLGGVVNLDCVNNTIQENVCGLSAGEILNLRFFHNNMMDNDVHASIPSNILPYSSLAWDNGYPSGGNYWSDCNGTDAYCSAYQNETGSDGIVDNSYVIDANNTDNYPLASPFGEATTLYVPSRYSTIQEAINAASDGDTVFVRNGMYYEHLTIDKLLSLEGENRNMTIIDGGYSEPANIIVVAADNVKISGFRIQHCRDGGSAVWTNSYVNLTFSNNIITGCNEGVRICNSSGSVISDNIVQDCHYNTGVGIDYGFNNTVCRNIIIHNHYGLSGGIDCHGNTFSENTIVNNDVGFGTTSYDNRFFHNNFVNNSVDVIASGANAWNNSREGNYWSKYSGSDSNGDGIGDTPCIIDANNIDNYPLMDPWSGSVEPSVHLILQPQDYMTRFMRTFTVNVTITNVTDLYGYEFKVHWNETLLDLVDVGITPPEAWGSSYILIKSNVSDSTYWHSLSALAPAPAFSGNATLVSLTFNVTYASALQFLYNTTLETSITIDESILADTSAHVILHDTSDCSAQILLVMMGDLNGDKSVNILDVVKIAIIYGQSGTPGWRIEDINCDGQITILDIVLITTNYGKKV